MKNLPSIFLCLTISFLCYGREMSPEKIEKLLQKTMAAFNVPAAQVAIVDGQNISYKKAFGLRNLEKQEKATLKTLFPIGSLSKPFTSFISGQMIDEGYFGWDTPVVNLLPYFRLKDIYATENVTIRDLLTHRVGFPRHDALWFNANFTRKQLVDRLRYLPTMYQFRDQFEYQNITYMVAGHIQEELYRKSWETLIKEKIFNPLGMESTTAYLSEFMKSKDRATGYREDEGKLVPTPYIDVSSIAPAAAINTNIEDLCSWMKLLNRNGEGFIETHTLNEIFTPQMISTSVTKDFGLEDVIQMESYGLGWMIISYRGELLCFHGGNIEGFSANLVYLPQRKISIAILTNKNLTPLPYIVAISLVDEIRDLEPIDWVEKFQQFSGYSKDLFQQDLDKIQVEKKHKETTQHPLEDFCGMYLHPAYGTMEIFLEGEDLKVRYNRMVFPIEHFHYNVFSITNDCFLPHIRGLKFTFIENTKGIIAKVEVPWEPKIDPICFEKQFAQDLLNHQYLDQFVGKYSYHGFGFTVERKGLFLVVTAMGQSPYLLYPEAPLQFKVKSHPGKLIQFRKDEEGNIISVQLVQENNTTYTAYRYGCNIN